MLIDELFIDLQDHLVLLEVLVANEPSHCVISHCVQSLQSRALVAMRLRLMSQSCYLSTVSSDHERCRKRPLESVDPLLRTEFPFVGFYLSRCPFLDRAKGRLSWLRS